MNDRIGLGLIGASVKGTWSSRSHLPALQDSDDFELTAVCTTRTDSAEAARQAYGAHLAFDDYRKMVESPEIDAVAVVVRVPSHHAAVKAALEAGKHVYCEWPLGRTTAEAEELSALAQAKGLVTAVGLQARVHPVLLHMKEQIEGGYLGEVLGVHVRLMREGVLSRPANRTWQRDAALGANTLTIANGHTLDAMRFVVGDLRELSAVVATQVKQWLDTDSQTLVDVTSPDNVLISGRLKNGAVASLHVGTVPFAGSGYRMEVYGREGTLVVSGEDSPQLGQLALQGARGGNALAPLPLPQGFAAKADDLAPRDAVNVGRLYASFAQAIRGGAASHPDFESAVALHRVIDAIEQASKSGRAVTVS
jgi:predicted dehydrogenase